MRGRSSGSGIPGGPMQPGGTVDVEAEEQLIRYLQGVGLLGPGERARCTPLAGGVSNRVVHVERSRGEALVVKQALERLRVAVPWFCSPERILRESQALQVLQRLVPPGCVPGFVHEDPSTQILVMEAVPPPHTNWKHDLLQGRIDGDLVHQFGTLLAAVHRNSRLPAFAPPEMLFDRSFFQTLRLEPYYAYTAERHPDRRAFFGALIEETLAQQVSLVHGDFSPKNILVRDGRLVLLDHEVAHVGDPAFDLGFALTHLLSKAHHLPARRTPFLQAARRFWSSYQAASSTVNGLESRAVRHTLACLLARVDGRSPLEYLSEQERDHQRTVVLGLLDAPPTRVHDLVANFGGRL